MKPTTARSYLYAPGDNEILMSKVFKTGADIVVLDLEDGVRPEAKAKARELVRGRLATTSAWVRINAPGSDEAADDLKAIAEAAVGLRVPKVESAKQVEWVTEQAGEKPLICGIESARGALAAAEIAEAPNVVALALGGIDLVRELDIQDGENELAHLRAQLCLASASAGIGQPIDRVYPRLNDDAGLVRDAHAARRQGFGGKSSIHPKQLSAIHAAFTPSTECLRWAQEVAVAFEAAGRAPTTLSSGEFVDLPVAERARSILARASGGYQDLIGGEKPFV